MARSQASKKQPRSRASRIWKGTKVSFCILLILLEAGFIYGSFEAAKRLQEAAELVPNLPDVMMELNQKPSQILADDGTVLYSVQAEYRETARRIELPNTVVHAILAAEDKRFYQHSGVDFRGLARVAKEALKDERATGASTLTMQIAKRVYTSNERKIERKLKDMSLAIMIERMLTKDQILELYLNQIYFGEGAYGIRAAADTYFGKELEDLTHAEAAMLARCVRLPSKETPFKDIEKATLNRNVVLNIMYEEGWLTKDEWQAAKKEEVKLRAEKPQVISAVKKHPYFVDYVLAQLKAKGIDISSGGYTVYTTIKPEYQKIADEEVKAGIKRFGRSAVNQMAFLGTDNNGRIRAMVGGPDYDKSEFNMIWMAPGRQPGSSFKPFVYAAAIELGALDARGSVSTETFYIRERGRRRPIKGGAGKGYISIASALAASNNTAAVRAQQKVGTNRVVRIAENSFGLVHSRLPAVPTLALGAGEVYMTEMAGAYSVFQSHGTRYPAYAIEKITFPDGSRKNMAPMPAKRVISSNTAEALDLFLRGVVSGGTGRGASGVVNARGKTGTTSDHKDAWFVGYTDTLIGIVWMGREEIVNGRPVAAKMRGVFGGEAAAPTWSRIMKRLTKLEKEKSRSFGRVPYVSNRPPADEEDDERDQPEPPVVPTTGGDQGDNPDTDVVTTSGEGGEATTTGGTTGANTTGGGSTTTTTGGGSTGGGNPPAQETVYISVCADSGQRASIYCPEAVRRPFVKGTGPGGSCPIHGPH